MVAVTKAGVATELDDMSNAPNIPSRHGRQRAATRQSKSEEVQRAAEHAPSHENETIRE
jgi:uncharacterized protein (UPF0147 family)